MFILNFSLRNIFVISYGIFSPTMLPKQGHSRKVTTSITSTFKANATTAIRLMQYMPLGTLGGIWPPHGVLAGSSLPDKEKGTRARLGVKKK